MSDAPSRAAGPHAGGDREPTRDGSVALEAVLVLPAVVLLLVAVLSLLAPLADVLAVEVAARAAARTVALSGDPAGGAATVEARVPGAQVEVVVADGVAVVTVVRERRVLGRTTVATGTARAPLEPAAGG